MLIAVDGCLGAGKTTVAEGLAAHRNCVALFEDFEANPFLRAFYADPAANAAETEFAFLLVHFHQLKHAANTIKTSEVVADFHLGKDLIYADLNLSDAVAIRLFGEMYEFCLNKTPEPTILIFLSATTDLIVERVRRRDREFEQSIDPEYYASVNRLYEQYFNRYAGKKIRVPMDEWDFVQDRSFYARLSSLVDEELSAT